MTLSISTPLISTGTFNASQFTEAVTSQSNRTQYTDAEVQHIGLRTISWCRFFGFNHDLVMSQMVHETDWFRFTGDVQFGQHNFAGLGATGGVPGHSFADIDNGVLAVVAHHAVYRWGEKSKWPADLQQYAGDAIDPRYSAVLSTGNAGKMFVLGDYRGTWAVPGRTYPESLINRSKQIGESVVGQIPGFTWHPADEHHYNKGRPILIRGGAQHYTGGTNSLSWLTTTSRPAVSSTFLVKHNPTMEDRGWQLVRLQDTAWTTSFANPYTVSIEYEHDGKQSIPNIAYEVLAQTWIDIAKEVEHRALGYIPLDRTGIRGHKEWVNNPSLPCPDGIFIDRIVNEINNIQIGGIPTVDFERVPTAPDPWKDHLGGNPYGREFWIPKPFIDEINNHGGFGPVGFVTGGAFQDGSQLVQYFERARLELNENGVVTRGLVGLEVLANRHPDRLP